MADVRKGKTETHAKRRTRATAKPPVTSTAKSSKKRAGALTVRKTSTQTSSRASAFYKASTRDSELKRLLCETQDQLSLIHGVLEELCERQEALAAWQLEFSKRLVTLQEAQWRSLEDLAGIDMGRPVEKAFGIQIDPADPEGKDDHWDEANKMLEDVNTQAMPKRAERIRRKRDPLRPSHSTVSENEDAPEFVEELRDHESSPASVFIMPPKVDVH